MASLNEMAKQLDKKITGHTSDNGHWGWKSEGVGIYPCAENEITFTSTHNSSDFWFNYRRNNGVKIKTFVFGDGEHHRTGNIDCGEVLATRVINAVWNDYAELFERGEETEPGDIICLDTSSTKEQYIKADSSSKRVIGVHSDTYGHLIGGEELDNYEDNFKKFIPIGLAGRVNVKVKGKVDIGDYIVPSDEKGIGRSYNKDIDDRDMIIGYLVESDNREDVRRLKMFINKK